MQRHMHDVFGWDHLGSKGAICISVLSARQVYFVIQRQIHNYSCLF